MAWAVLSGCGTGSATQFPSREQLQRLTEREAAAYPLKGELADVEEWELVGPLPSQIDDEAAALDEPWRSVAVKLAGTRPGLVLASNSAACMARELGHFFAAKRARMSGALERFIAARCGVTGSPQISHGFRYQVVHGPIDERQVATEWGPQVEGEMQKAIAGSSGAHLVGMWFGRRQDVVVASWVVIPRQARVTAMAMVPDGDGQVAIRGEVLQRAEKVEGIINRGAYGFQRCSSDPTVKMPQFALRCRADGSDALASLQVAAFEPGRVLGHTILSFVVWPAGEIGNRYRRPALAETDGSPSGANLASELAGLVDQVRKRAGMKPLKFSEPESRAARQLVPHYFAALNGLEDETVADLVVLGLRAGWDIGTRLRLGQCTSGLAEGAPSAARMLSEVLELPTGRETLLDPQADHIAVGTVGGPAHGFLGALFATYTDFELGDVQKHVEKVELRLNELRRLKGLPQAERLPKLEVDLAAIVGSAVSSGKISANQGLARATEMAAERTRAPVRAAYVDAVNLDELTIPDEILAAQPLRVAIAVGEHQAPNDPWHRYIVYFVMVQGTSVLALAQGRF